jgi:hypothetical protein
MRLGGALSPEDDKVCARVTERIDTGERIVAGLSLFGQDGWTIKLDPGTGGQICAGDEIEISWRPEDCLVFPQI